MAIIRENIPYGAGLEFNGSEEGWRSSALPMENIITAAKKANADSFIMRLPEKYETMPGNRGPF